METEQNTFAFSVTQLRDAGLVVEGHFPDITVLSATTIEPARNIHLPVEARLGRESDGSPITTFHPIDMELGKEFILGQNA